MKTTSLVIGLFLAFFVFANCQPAQAVAQLDPKTTTGHELSVRAKKHSFSASENATFDISDQPGLITKGLRFFKGIFGISKPDLRDSLEIKASNEMGVEIENIIISRVNEDLYVEIPHDKLKPGKYKLDILRDGKTLTQEFYWGVLAINSDKATYHPGESAYLQMAALDDRGDTLCDANLSLTIITPSGADVTLTTQSESIKKSGSCNGNNVTLTPDYFANFTLTEIGRYQTSLTNLDNGFQLDDHFDVAENQAFEVQRTGPTRIWPIAPYEMTFKVKANQNFTGEIREKIPANFVVKNVIQEKTGPTTTLIWPVQLTAGQEIELSYTFDAPDISPEFYFLGPLELVTYSDESLVFEESRRWQIASDAVAGPNFAGTGANFNDGGNLAWTNPTNVVGDTTGTAATISLASNGHTSQMLRATNFGFSIPTGAQIDGVTVEIEAQSGNNNRQYWNNVQLIKGGTEAGNNLSDGAAIFGKAFKTFGSSSEDWGAGLTPADVNASNFGVSIKVARSGNATTTSIYRVRITVDYTELTTISGNIYQAGSESSTNSTPVSVSVSVNNGTPTTVTSQTSSYSVNVEMATGNTVAVYVDGHSTIDANTFTVGNGSAISNLHLYTGKTAIYNHNSSNTTNSHICTTQATYPTSGDRTYTCPGSNVLTATTAQGSDELHVAGGYAPGANVNASKLHLVSGGTYSGSSETLTLSGTGTGTARPLYIDGGTFTPSTNTTVFTGNSSSDVQNTSYYNLTFNGTGPFNALGTTTVNRELLLSAGTFALGANSLAVGSTGVTNSGSIKVASGATVSQSSAATTTVLSSASGTNCIGSSGASCVGTPGTIGFYNLTIGNGSTTVTTDTAGTTPQVSIANVLNITNNATFRLNQDATVILSGSGTPISNSGSLQNHVNGSTVKYTSGSGVSNLASSSASSIGFDRLVIEGSGTFNAGIDVVAGRALTVTSGTLAMGSQDLYAGDASLATAGEIKVASGATFSQSSSGTTYTYSANSGNTCIGGSGAACSGAQGTINFGNLVIGSGSTTTTTTLAGDSPVINISGTALGLYVNGSGTLSANGTINLATDFYRASAGTFVANSSTLNLTGGGGTTQLIDGSAGTTFYNLSATGSSARTIKFVSGLTTTVTNSLTLSGAAGQLLTLDPITASTIWTIAPPASNVSIDYVDVNYSTATECISATNSTGSNTTLWYLNGESCTPSTTKSTTNSFQRKTWHDGTNFWRSYLNETANRIEFEYSADGDSWTENTSARIDTDTADFSIQANSTDLYIAYETGAAYDIEVRKASDYTTTSFSWGTAVVALDGTSSTDYYQHPVIAKGSNNIIWVAGVKNSSGTYSFDVVASTSANDISAWNTSTSLASSENSSNHGLITPMTSGNMYAAFVIGTTIKGCLYDEVGDDRWEDSQGDVCDAQGGEEDATIAFVQSATDDSSNADATEVTMTFAGAPAAGNLLVAHLHLSAGRSFTTPAGWTSAVSQNDRGHIFYRIAGESEPSAHTFTFASGLATRINGHLIEYSGMHETQGEVLDKVVGNLNESTGFASTGTTATTVFANALASASVGTNGARTFSSWTNSFTGNVTTLPRSATASRILTATGTYETTATLSSSVTNEIGVMAVFRGGVSSTPAQVDEIGATTGSIADNLSAVADESGNVHLLYINDSGQTIYRKYTTSWQTEVTLDSNAGNSYPTISLDTNNGDLYAFWIRDDDIFYKKGASPYGSGDWDTSATSWQASGTNTHASSSLIDGGNSISVLWNDGSDIAFDTILLASSFISITITTDGVVAYGTLGPGQSVDTLSLTDTQTAKNDGSSAINLNIKTSAPSGWTLGASSGSDTFVHEFSTNGGADWTKFTSSDNYQSLASGLAVDATLDFDLRFTAPNPSTSSEEKTITTVIQAVQE